MTDLHKAIDFAQQALHRCPSKHHPNHSMYLNTLAFRLFLRYQSLGDMADLSQAIILGRQALDVSLPEHPDRSMYLNHLATYISNQHKRLGELTDLKEAISYAKQALDISPPDHTYHSACLNGVSASLLDQYKRLGETADLDKAIDLGHKALDTTLPGHPNRSAYLNNLAACLFNRHKQLGERTDLNEAIVLGREALKITPSGHPHYPIYLNDVATCLADRYKLLNELVDLNDAIDFGREALEITLPLHPHRSVYLTSVAACLSDRYICLGKMVDLDNAITLERKALDIHPLGHPKRSQSLEQLTSCLSTRLTKSNNSKDKEDLFNLYEELSQAPQIFSSSDLFAAEKWVSAAENFHHPTLLLAYETSLRLLAQRLATVSSFPQSFKNLTSSLAVNAFSAYLRSSRITDGVELLEQGRVLFWSLISGLRFPLGDVIASGPVGKLLADEFTSLQRSILDVINSHSAVQHDRLCSLNLELQVVITNIRQLPGLTHFLLPSPFSDLQRAARDGPVIILNASRYTCDAVVVLFDSDPVHIPLKITKSSIQKMTSEFQSLISQARKMDVNTNLSNFLRTLWDEVVSPIVDFLQKVLPIMSRIWWYPTAEFSFLPLHAAGPFREGQPNLPQLYISSYTPTLTSLIRATVADK